MRTEYSYEAENIEPFCDIYYIDCFYNALFPILNHWGVDKKVIMGSYVPILQKDDEIGAGLTWKCAGTRCDILKNNGIEESEYLCKQDICEVVKQHLDRDELVIVYIDCFYEKGRFDTFMKEHWPHTILIYGYDEISEEFSILEHTAKENLDYTPWKIGYGDLVKCYQSLLRLYANDERATLFCYSRQNDGEGSGSKINSLISAFIKNRELFADTAKIVLAFKDKMQELLKDGNAYLAKVQDVIQLLTDIINSKYVFEYVMNLFNEEELVARSELIREKWMAIRNSVVRNSLTNTVKLA